MRMGFVVLRYIANVASLCLALFCSRGVGQTTYNGITLTGKLIWHSYTDYGFIGVQSWMANFGTGVVYQITPSNVSGAMNYHFNQNSTEVVFMGTDNAYSNQVWDIWVASVTSTGLANITKITSGSTDGSRNEDPKFSSDGTKIIFKKNLNYIYSINRSSFSVNGAAQTPPETRLLASSHEVSMPYYLVGSDINFVFTDNATSNSTIQYDNGERMTTPYAPSGLHAYYPIALNSTQFYFSQSDSANHDQIYRGDISGSVAVGAVFNVSSCEIADPFAMDPNWVAYSSTRPGGAGSYDIWIGNFSTRVTYNLNNWLHAANQTNSDLGATFYGTVATSGQHLVD